MNKLIKYFFTGAIAAIVDFSIFAALVKVVGWPWYFAGLFSFIFATIVNYILSIKHVFTSGVRFKKQDEITLTFLVSAFGLLINQVILFLFIRAGIAIFLGKIGATGTVFFWNYAARHCFVFRENAPPV